jgi:hypothetical protein
MSVLLHVLETWSLILRKEHCSEMPEKKYSGTHQNLKGAKKESGGKIFKMSSLVICPLRYIQGEHKVFL